jgi:hypothetical protein
MLPSTITPRIDDIKNPYQRYKEKLAEGAISHEAYQKNVSKIMMRKKGNIRSMTSIRIEGSMKMVISIGQSTDKSTVLIPSVVAKNIRVPYLLGDSVTSRGLRTGDRAMLVRQPCLWSGGIQPIIIKVTDPIIRKSGEHKWDVNYTIRIPPKMCSPYAADFDGDEMTIFPLLSGNSVKECSSFKWNYSSITEDNISSFVTPKTSNYVLKDPFNDLSVRTTTCWSDSIYRCFKITEAHKACQLSLSSFRGLHVTHQSPLDFANKAHYLVPTLSKSMR